MKEKNKANRIFFSTKWLIKDVKNIFNNYEIVDDVNNSDIIIYSNFEPYLQNINKFKILFNFEPEECNLKSDLYFTFNSKYSFPYFLCWQESILNKKTIDYKNNKEKDCVYLYSKSHPHRHKLFHKLKNILKIDCLGFDNPDFPNENDKKYDRNDENWSDIAIEKYKKYKYVIACENSFGKNYITEKIVLPFLAGCIPIYCGPSEVFKWFNKNSFIYISPEEIDNADQIFLNSLDNYENQQNEFILNDGKLNYEYTFKYYSDVINNINNININNKKIIILYMNCYKQINNIKKIDLFKNYNDNLKNYPNIFVYHVLGNNDNNIVFDSDVPIINSNCPDNYEYFITKVFNSIKEVYKLHPDLDFIFKVDDDININISKIENFINNNIDIDYAGLCLKTETYLLSTYHFNKCDDNILNKTPILLPPYYCVSGTLYFLSKKSVDIINNIKDTPTPYKDILNEDVYFGNLLKNNGINLKNMNIYSHNNEEYLKNENCIGNFI